MSVSMRSSLVLVVSIVLVSALIQMASVEGAPPREPKDSNQGSIEMRKFKPIYKIIRAYLLTELDELDKLSEQIESENAIESYLNSNSDGRVNYDGELVAKRQLKTQGIIERIRNKMDHDINKYGWEKK